MDEIKTILYNNHCKDIDVIKLIFVYKFELEHVLLKQKLNKEFKESFSFISFNLNQNYQSFHTLKCNKYLYEISILYDYQPDFHNLTINKCKYYYGNQQYEKKYSTFNY